MDNLNGSTRQPAYSDFSTTNITDGLVRFFHDNSINAPAYQLAVSNGVITSPHKRL